MTAHRVHNIRPRPSRVSTLGKLAEAVSAEVGGQDDQRLLKVHRPPLPIGQDAIVQHLQQHVEDVRMRLFDLVKQHDLIGPAPHRFGQDPTLIIADIAGWRADQTADRVLFHKFTHVDPHHRPIIVKQILRQRLGQFGLADAGWPEEQERPQRPPLVIQPGARAPHSIGHCRHGSLLADNPLAKLIFHLQKLFLLALQHPRHRDAGPALDHLGNLLGPHRF